MGGVDPLVIWLTILSYFFKVGYHLHVVSVGLYSNIVDYLTITYESHIESILKRYRFLTPQYNMVDDLMLFYMSFCSHAILMHLACTYHVPDHWYPTDLCKRAKLHSILDWHHTNLRRGAMEYLVNTILAPLFGKSPNPQGASECEQVLVASLKTIETVWLNDESKFLLGSKKPSIADLALVSEILQLHMLSVEERNRMVGPYKRVEKWIEDVKNATNPHFVEVHQHLFEVIASLKQKA